MNESTGLSSGIAAASLAFLNQKARAERAEAEICRMKDVFRKLSGFEYATSEKIALARAELGDGK